MLGTIKHEMPGWVAEIDYKKLATTTKGIGTCNIMLVKYLGVGPLWDTGAQ